MKWTPEMCREQLKWKQTYALDRLTKRQLTKGIKTLKALIQKAENGEVQARDGICRHWAGLWPLSLGGRAVAYNIVFVVNMWWEHPMRASALGDYSAFPIQEPEDNQHYWEGDQLEARLHLMRYILKRLRDWRRRAPE